MRSEDTQGSCWDTQSSWWVSPVEEERLEMGSGVGKGLSYHPQDRWGDLVAMKTAFREDFQRHGNALLVTVMN